MTTSACRPSNPTRHSILDLHLPATALAAAQARRAVSALAPDPATADDGRLLVSEAVANAVEHTATDQVRVLLSHDPAERRLVCAVRDNSTAVPSPEPHDTPDLDGVRGRGLHLIEALADSWGYLPDEDGKWLWFSLTSAPVNAAA